MSKNQNSIKKHCKGYWIPLELMALGLNMVESALLSLIDTLDSGDPDYCYASNSYLAKEMDLSESRISFYITKFKRLNLIKEISFSGRTRRLMVLKENWYKRNSKKESCVKTRRQTTRKQEGRLRENAMPIYKDEYIAEEIVDKPAGGATAIFPCLEKIEHPISERDKKRICQKYSEEQVLQALAAAQAKESHPKGFLFTLNAALKNGWESPPIKPKEDQEENRKYAEKIEKSINQIDLKKSGYGIYLGPTYFEINQPNGRNTITIKFSEIGFKEKLINELKNKNILKRKV